MYDGGHRSARFHRDLDLRHQVSMVLFRRPTAPRGDAPSRPADLLDTRVHTLLLPMSWFPFHDGAMWTSASMEKEGDEYLVVSQDSARILLRRYWRKLGRKLTCVSFRRRCDEVAAIASEPFVFVHAEQQKGT